jgi:hypothetical protein
MSKAFSLPSIKALIGHGVSFDSDGLICFHGADFLADREFMAAYRCGVARLDSDPHAEWRLRVAIWAAAQGMKLGGDFVECGVNTGIITGTIVEHLRWNETCGTRRIYLLDTFKGIPTDGLDPEDIKETLRRNRHFSDIFEVVQGHFAKYRNIVFVQGRIPETLQQVPSTAIAYLSIDMNLATPEIEAGEFFWPRLLPGAPILLDDYNYRGFERQRRAWDKFAIRHDVNILPLPTGQGIIIKPPCDSLSDR